VLTQSSLQDAIADLLDVPSAWKFAPVSMPDVFACAPPLAVLFFFHTML
jgi:hypothetical protein